MPTHHAPAAESLLNKQKFNGYLLPGWNQTRTCIHRTVLKRFQGPTTVIKASVPPRPAGRRRCSCWALHSDH
jgi:hypothetical protein